VYAEGARSALDSMKDFLISNPGASHVTNVDYRDVIPLETFKSFSIEY
jgi:acylphosphatase